MDLSQPVSLYRGVLGTLGLPTHTPGEVSQLSSVHSDERIAQLNYS